MTIKETLEQRAKFRAECRTVADNLVKIIIDTIDKLPEDQQASAIGMLMSELQIAIKSSKKD